MLNFQQLKSSLANVPLIVTMGDEEERFCRALKGAVRVAGYSSIQNFEYLNF